MEGVNPYAAELASLQDQLAAAQTERATARTRVLELQYQLNQTIPTGNLGAIQGLSQQVQGATRAYNDADARVKGIEAQIVTATTAKERYDAALASAAAEGLTGEAANIRAQSLVTAAEGQRKLMMYAGIALLIIAVVAAIVWYRRRK